MLERETDTRFREARGLSHLTGLTGVVWRNKQTTVDGAASNEWMMIEGARDRKRRHVAAYIERANSRGGSGQVKATTITIVMNGLSRSGHAAPPRGDNAATSDRALSAWEGIEHAMTTPLNRAVELRMKRSRGHHRATQTENEMGRSWASGPPGDVAGAASSLSWPLGLCFSSRRCSPPLCLILRALFCHLLGRCPVWRDPWPPPRLR